MSVVHAMKLSFTSNDLPEVVLESVFYSKDVGLPLMSFKQYLDARAQKIGREASD